MLCSFQKWDDRELETTPELLRLPLTQLVMHSATFGIHPEELTFDQPIEAVKLEEAIVRLTRLGLVDDDCNLTEAGRFVSHLPVSFSTGAMLWHAKQTGILGAALPLAAVMETDGIRKDFRLDHGMDTTSDWLDALKAFQSILGVECNRTRQLHMTQKNVGFKRMEAAKALYRKLQRSFNEKDIAATSKASDAQLRQCILAGAIDSLFKQAPYSRGFARVVGNQFEDYNLGNGTAVFVGSRDLVVGNLRTIKPKNGRSPFTILEKLTKVTPEDLLALAAVRPQIFSMTSRQEETVFGDKVRVTKVFIFGEYLIEETRTPLQPEARCA